MMQALRIILLAALLVAVYWLGTQLYRTIEEPIKFEQEKQVRDEAGQSKLKFIRELQLAYKSTNDTFANSFASLIDYGKNGILEVEKIIGDPNDSTVVSRTEIIKVSVRDSILNKNKRFEIEELATVPFSNEKFTIQSGKVVKNDLEISAFEVSTPYQTLYNGLIKKYYSEKLNKNISVGSMLDGSTAGSWGS